MAHSLSPASATVASISTRYAGNNPTPLVVSVRSRVVEDQNACSILQDKLICRRNVGFGLAGCVLGLVIEGEQHAVAAARRPPPPPPEERKDPNVSGVQAKVLASKRRKEAMKEEVERLRQKGKAINPVKPEPKP